MSILLSCKDIELKAGYQTLITSFQLDVFQSESIVLTGSNGCGKTSLLKVFSNISKPHKGNVTINENVCSLYLSHIPSLLMDHSVQWNLEFYCEAYQKNLMQMNI